MTDPYGLYGPAVVLALWRSSGEYGRRKLRGTHEPLIDGSGRRTTLCDRPHYETLAATHVAGHEHAFDVGLPPIVTFDITASCEIDPKLLE